MPLSFSPTWTFRRLVFENVLPHFCIIQRSLKLTATVMMTLVVLIPMLTTVMPKMIVAVLLMEMLMTSATLLTVLMVLTIPHRRAKATMVIKIKADLLTRQHARTMAAILN
ncbi:hypothetical protein DM01DRAFT_1000792 [Hesseltinella vesiculosa]|uniref:Uncharacterized protein n=1 Tax=Hesseltinella vesiculosa TaxID=101127 RepID=A0A1X2GY44_9FUNG|nr:hypothetical protein DM01DRAFT_1000792 [Hesseltinella vesiculosa]